MIGRTNWSMFHFWSQKITKIQQNDFFSQKMAKIRQNGGSLWGTNWTMFHFWSQTTTKIQKNWTNWPYLANMVNLAYLVKLIIFENWTNWPYLGRRDPSLGMQKKNFWGASGYQQFRLPRGEFSRAKMTPPSDLPSLCAFSPAKLTWLIIQLWPWEIHTPKLSYVIFLGTSDPDVSTA